MIKDGPTKFRFTTDLRPVNRYKISFQYPLRNMEQELVKVLESKYFANVEFCQSHWQLALDPESRAIESIIASGDVYSPARVVHGTKNAVMHLQSSILSDIPPSLRRHVLLWLNDVLQHATTPKTVMDAVNNFSHFAKSST